MCCRLGHNVGNVEIVEATIAVGRLGASKLISMLMDPEEMNKGMDEMDSRVGDSQIFSRFGKKGLSMAQICSTESASEYSPGCTKSFRILWVYFRKRAHSNVVGSLRKTFQTRSFNIARVRIVRGLTVHSYSFQTSSGKVLSNGSSVPWTCHNMSNIGSSRLLQQHARATDVAFPPDSTSLRAISLTTSSMQRQGCIEPGRCVEPGVGGGEESENSQLMPVFPGWGHSNRNASPQAGVRALEVNKRQFTAIGRRGQPLLYWLFKISRPRRDHPTIPFHGLLHLELSRLHCGMYCSRVRTPRTASSSTRLGYKRLQEQGVSNPDPA